jgi:hypothetical protein
MFGAAWADFSRSGRGPPLQTMEEPIAAADAAADVAAHIAAAAIAAAVDAAPEDPIVADVDADDELFDEPRRPSARRLRATSNGGGTALGDLLVVAEQNSFALPAELQWAAHAKRAAMNARRKAHRANADAPSTRVPLSAGLLTGRGASLSPRLPRLPPSAATRALTTVDAQHRRAQTARSRAFASLAAAEAAMDSDAAVRTAVAPGVSRAPVASARTVALARPRTGVPAGAASPRIPCVQAGHHQLLLGELDAALPLYSAALYRKEAALGAHNPSTVSSLLSVADVLTGSGRPAEAVPLLHRALEARAATRGHTHLATLDVTARLARTLRQCAGCEAQVLALERQLAMAGRPLNSGVPPAKEAVVAGAERGSPTVAAAARTAELALADIDRVRVRISSARRERARAEAAADAPHELTSYEAAS